MKKNYFLIILLILNSIDSFGQCQTLSGDNKVCINTTETYAAVSGGSNYIWTFVGGTLNSGGSTNDNTITINWGSTPGNYNISVTFDGAPSSSCVGTITAALTVSVNTKPITPNVSPLNYCLNSASDIQDAISGPITDLLWYTVSTGGTPTSLPPTIDTGVAGTTSYWVSKDGGGPSCESDRAEIVVTINALPTTTAGSNSPLCSDSTLNLTASGGTSYSWTGPNGFISTSQNPSITNITTAASGDYIVTVTDGNGCVNTSTVTVTVQSAVTSGAINATGETICYNGNPANITSTTAASGGDGAITYEWRANGTTIASSNTATYDPPTGLTATTTYTRWAKDNTCNTTFTQSTGSQVVIVNTNFTAGAIIATGETICYNGNPANITSTTAASGGDGAITYEWRANGTTIASSNTATYDPPTGLTATTTYTRWAKDNTCNTTFTQSTGSQVVIVNPNFTAGAINATGETICYNANPANITSTTPASGGDGAITYEWRANGTPIASSNTTTYDPPTGLTATTTYTRWAKDNTCNTTFTQSTGSQVVIVNPNFTAGAIIATGETICYNGNPANITSTTPASGGDGAITYEWRANGTPIASSNTATYDPPTGLTATTTYTRWAKDNTCNTTFTQSTGSQVVIVNPNFTAGAIIATGETICYNGNPVNITSTTPASGGDGAITYEWRANGTPIASSNTATYDPPTGLTATTTYTRWAKDNTCNTTFTQSTGSQSVIVNPNFTAGAIITTGETICYNSNPANMTSTTPASGGDGAITYEWRANGTPIASSNTATYDPPTGLTVTTTYTRWAKDNTCNTTFTQSTGSRIVTVNPNFTAGAINATGETICYNGNPANIISTTAASGGDGTITYKWQANGVDIAGATTANFDPPTGLIATTTYTRLAKDNTCNAFTQSTGSRIVTVNPNFTAGAINATGETICYNGNPANITSTTLASGGDGTITYRWQANGTTITGATSAAFDPPTGLIATTTYTRWAKDNTCNTTFTQSIGSQIVIVNPNFTAGAIIATGETICYNGNPANITSTTLASGGDGAITYEWRANGTPIASSNTAAYDPPTGLAATTTYTRWAKDNTCNTTFTQSTGSRIVTVRPNFTAGAINATGETICYNGNPANITSTSGASGGDGAITYKWQANGVDIASSSTAAYDPPTGLLATTTYTRWAKDNTCNTFTLSTGSQVVTVNPLPIGSASPQTICSAGTTSIALNSSVSNTSFTWTASIQTTPTGGTITGQSVCSAGCGSSIIQTLTNTGTTVGVVRYTVTPIANSCPGPTFTVDVTVNPKPVVTLANITGQCSVTVPVPTATDNCGVAVTGTTGDPLFFNTEGPHTVNWSFDFGNGIVIVKTQNITIDDTIAPSADIATLPALTISGCEVASIAPPTANDNCKGTISGTTTTPFPITKQGQTIVTWTYNDGNGNTATQTQNVTLTAPPISGGTLVGSVTGLTPAATPSDNIAINSCPDDINPVTMNLSGQVGTIIRWEKFEAGDTAWSVISNTTNTYDIIFNFDNTKSTLFRVVIQVGNCTTYSNMVNVHAIPPDVPPILDQSDFNICLNDSVSLVARSGYSSTVNVGEGGDFDLGQFPDKWDPTQWRIDDQVAGAQWTAAGNNTKFNNWSGTNDHPVGTLYNIRYDSDDFKFGIAHGNYNSAAYIAEFGVGPTTLETPLFSLVGLQTAAVEFDQAYNLHAGDIAKLELLIFAANGTTLENTIVLQNLIGTSPQANSWAPVPYPYKTSPTTNFNFKTDNSSFDISDYIGNNNVRVKWTFFGTTDESAWAVDNISIPVRPYFDDVEWTDGIGEPGEYIIRNKLEAVYNFVPSAPGVHLYGATSLINGCRAYDADGTAIATVKVNYAYAGQAQGYTNAECGERTVNLNAYDNTESANKNNDDGAYPTLVRNDFSDDPGTGATGKWTVYNTTNTCGTYSFSNDASPTSSFSGDAGVYTLRWTLVGSGCYSDIVVTLTSCDVIDFDGVNDYVEFNKNSYGLGSDFAIEVWIKPDPQPANPVSTIQTIISKRNANSLIDGYDLRLIGNSLSFNWNNGSQIISPFPLTSSRWYHVAITRNEGIYRLYVDGIEVINAAGSAPLSNTSTCIAGAMDQSGNPPNRPVHHFSGWIDELRIWNIGLDSHHVRQMMNQQIINNGTAVRGEIIPIDISGPDANQDGIDDKPLNWSNLLGYYRMNLIDCGYLKPFAGKGADGKLRNITSSQEETAPLPYVSIRDGNWMDRGAGTTPWKFGDSVWDYPNSTGYNGTLIDWNIVQTAHNINSGNKDITVLGLISTAGKLTIADPVITTPIENNDGQGLWITHYLKLNGNIDLVGESQLVEKRHTPTQFSESILDVTSVGYIERDQQGKKNSYNYNYWSSPVSTIQGSVNNTPYIINNILRDGTDSAAPVNINFGSPFDFADTPSTPIKITDRWIWSYNYQITDGADWDNYFQWNHIKSTGSLKAGEGFTMKGSGGAAALTVKQNHVFIGKPNSGTISLNLIKEYSYLIGNPYPSALDANEFILDNLAGRAGVNVFNGALYFWDHFGLSNNHYLAEYEGGYATYTLVGGVEGINDSPLTLNDGATGSKTETPKRFIPVGQGFFIDGYLDPALSGTTTTVDAGPILFKNSQRVFVRESSAGSIFMKNAGTKSTRTQETTDTRLKIRLGFDSPIGAHRQLLVGADPNTTNLFDIGYDAPMFDTNDNDMFWEISNSQFVIQGVPNFDDSQIIPLGITIANEGLSTIKIDTLENFPNTTRIYLFDDLTSKYHNIRESDFKISLPIGEYSNRFSLRFADKTLRVDDFTLPVSIVIYFTNNTKILNITNKFIDGTVNKVFLFNLLGQSITNWDVQEQKQNNIQIPIKNVPSGVYIVKVKTTKGVFSKKIIIR